MWTGEGKRRKEVDEEMRESMGRWMRRLGRERC